MVKIWIGGLVMSLLNSVQYRHCEAARLSAEPSNLR